MSDLQQWQLKHPTINMTKYKFPDGLTHTCLSPEKTDAWIIREEDNPKYFEYIPFIEKVPGHEIRVYYININPESQKYLDMIVLHCPACGGFWFDNEYGHYGDENVSYILDHSMNEQKN
jgi:hypothetical protein